MDIAYMMFDPTDTINRKIAFRRELVFVFLSGLFLGTLAILNILGIPRLNESVCRAKRSLSMTGLTLTLSMKRWIFSMIGAASSLAVMPK